MRLAAHARFNFPDEFWEQEFCLYESKALYKQGNYKEAIAKAHESVEWRIRKPGTKSEIPYWLSEIVLRTESKESYEKCLETLLMLHYETPFPKTEFNFHGFSALLHSRLGNHNKAAHEALAALSWAAKDKNLLQNGRKRKFGIFKQQNSWPYSEIVKVASN